MCSIKRNKLIAIKIKDNPLKNTKNFFIDGLFLYKLYFYYLYKIYFIFISTNIIQLIFIFNNQLISHYLIMGDYQTLREKVN